MGSRLLRALAPLALFAAATAALAQGAPPTPEAGRNIAIFAGGCFWCMEHPFDLGHRRLHRGYQIKADL